MDERGGYNREKPPEDDCCPICFGEFTVPCKANCGHWFCGSCILQLWECRWRPRRCICPFCSSAISKLGPHLLSVSNTEDELVVEVLENIEQYNRFCVEGIKGYFLMWKHLTSFHLDIWTSLVDLIRHPERIEDNYWRLRWISYPLNFFLPLFIGSLPRGQRRLEFTMVTFAPFILVFVPYMAVMCKIWAHIWWLKFQIGKLRWEVEDLRGHNAAFQENEAALQAQVDALRVQEAALGEFL